MSKGIRLQRFLAQAGVTSRRKAEVLITEGHVRVNGKVVTLLGTRVSPHRDRVEVHGKRVVAEELQYLLLNKPTGYVTTLDDPEGRPTVADLLPQDGPRLFPVGRLDYYSEGVLLCTNDGELAHALTHPSRHVSKRYLVRIRGEVADDKLAALGRGVELDDGPTKPLAVLVRAHTRSHTWLDVTVHEGRNRLIRRMCEALELPVMRLLRAEFAGLDVENQKPGTWRELSTKEVAKLRQAAGLKRRNIHSGRLTGAPVGRRGQSRKQRTGKGREGRPPTRGRPEPGARSQQRRRPRRKR